MAKVRACWFSCWLFPRNALQEKEGWNTCRKEILLRRPLSGILFFMTWFALFSFLVLCLLRFVVLQMKSKMLLIVYWITGNVAAHPIQCEIMLTTWLNSSAVPLLCPTRPRNPHIHIYRLMYIHMYVGMSCNLIMPLRLKIAHSTPRIGSIKGIEHLRLEHVCTKFKSNWLH